MHTDPHASVVERACAGDAAAVEALIAIALETGRVTLGRALFGASVRESARRFGDVEREVRRLEELRRAAALYRSHPELTPPEPAC